MSIITVPDVLKKRIAEAELLFQPVDFQNRSMFTRSRQVLAFPTGYIWAMRCSLGETEPDEAAIIRSFLMRLEGRQNVFRFPVPGYVGRQLSGYTGAAGLVNGGSQLGRQIITDGWANSTRVIANGEYLTINDELKVATADASSNGSGQATINFLPPLRVPPPDNAPIVIDSPHALMAKAESEVTAQLRAPHRSKYDLVCEEAVVAPS